MSEPLDHQALNALLAALDCDRERASARYEQIRQHLICRFEHFESPPDLANETFKRCAEMLKRGMVPPALLPAALRIVSFEIDKKPRAAREFRVFLEGQDSQAIPPAEEPNLVPPAAVSNQSRHRRKPPLEPLRRHLQTHFPLLYNHVLEPTLADLREEHSAALNARCPWKARCVFLRGCGALAAAAVCQLGYSLLGRIAALWQARSPK